MKKLHTFLLVAFMTTFFFNTSLNAQCAVNQVSTISTANTFPQIDGKAIVWQGTISGSTGKQIFKFDGTNITQLSTTSDNNNNAQIDGKTVVWNGVVNNVLHVFKHDGTNTTQLTTTTIINGNQDIQGNTIVWEGRANNVAHIFKHDGTNTTQLSTTSTSNSTPQIDGNTVVWHGFTGGVNHIFKHDGTAVTQISTTSTENKNAQVSGKIIVWQGSIGGVQHIFKYDGTAVTQLSTTSTANTLPQIQGNTIVWTGKTIGGVAHIFKYDGTTITQLSTTSTANTLPQIDGKNVIWQGNMNGIDHIFKHDGTNVTQISTTSTANANAQIHGNAIVWQGEEAGVKNIYRAVCSACVQVANATQNMTWNGTVSNDWNDPCNWSPNGIPTVTNQVIIDKVATFPVVLSGATAVAKEIYINKDASLKVNSGGILNVNVTKVSVSITFQGINSSLTNEGTINLGNDSGLSASTGGNVVNRGTINSKNSIGVWATLSDNFIFINEPTGIFNGNIIATLGTLKVINRGIINYSDGGHTINFNNKSTLVNEGTILIGSGGGIYNRAGCTITNNACGKILMTSGSYVNDGGLTSNAGLLSVTNDASNIGGGTFNNTGILKYGILKGTITNNENSSLVINNNKNPIFTYGGTYDGVINGIFKDSLATVSAGTFATPNTFTPSATLPKILLKLYAKITPKGGACEYIVPFTYNNISTPTKELALDLINLQQNRPNPFSEATTISFILNENTKANLIVYDIIGKQIFSIQKEFIEGKNDITLEKSLFPTTGTYFYQLTSGKFMVVKKMQFVAE